MKFKSINAMLLVVASFITLIISISTLYGSTMHEQFIHLLQPSPLGTAVIAASAGQSQSSENPTLQSSVSMSPPPRSSTYLSLPDIFQKVENSVVQITSTKSNPNEIIIENGVPATGKSTALGSGFVYDNQGHIVTNN